MNDVTRYADMKDSGIWELKDIPSEWKIIKIKYIAKLDPYCESSNIDDNSYVSFVPMECIKNNNVTEKSSKKYKYNSSYSTFINGDIAIAKVTPCFENGNIVIMKNLINGFGFGSSELFILRPFKVDTKFLFYALQSHSFKEGAVSIMTGTGGLKRVSSTYMKNAFIAMPHEYEQKRISCYLDSQCAKIGDIIAGARTSIDEYKKWKASVIYEAVTKGLDPHAEMKDSGVAWIGKIPKHWKAIKAKFLVSIENGSDPVSEGDIPVYGSGSSSFKTCGESKKFPSVLLGRKGATLHIPHYINEPFWNVDTAFNVYVKNNNILLLFYYYCSICFDYKYYISATTLPSMTQTNYKGMVIPVPTINEQYEIVSYLDTKCSEIDQLISEKEVLISDLESYKKSLIYEVVTGKRNII